MANEVSSIQAKLYYSVETVSGTRPLTLAAFTAIADIKEIPEQSLEPDGIEVTNLNDTIKRYIAGLQDPGSSLGFMFNITSAFITAWNTTLYGAWETGRDTAAPLATWFAIEIPFLDFSYYVSVDPVKLGINGLSVGEVVEAMGYVTPRDTVGWAVALTS